MTTFYTYSVTTPYTYPPFRDFLTIPADNVIYILGLLGFGLGGCVSLLINLFSNNILVKLFKATILNSLFGLSDFERVKELLILESILGKNFANDLEKSANYFNTKKNNIDVSTSNVTLDKVEENTEDTTKGLTLKKIEKLEVRPEEKKQ